MSDTVYRPISDADTESETPSPTTELPIASWGDFRKELEEQHDVSHDALTPEEAADSIRSRRAETPTPENARERPIVVHKSQGDGPKTLRQATDDLAYSRGLKMREELLEAGHTEEEVQQLGVEKLEQARRGDPLDPPPVEVKIADEPGKENDPLTVEEASRRLTEWRAQQAAQREAELAEFDAERQQRQQDYEQQQQQQPEPQQQPAQPTPEQTERAQLAQERWRIAQLKQMDGFEAAARTEYDQQVAAVVQAFPSLRNGPPTPEQVEDLRQKDPERHALLVQADQLLRQSQQRIAAMAQQRGLREQQQAQASAQQRAAARAEQDRAFEASAAKHIPNWQSVQGEVRAQARKTLEAAGLSPAEIHHLWTGDHSIDAHSSVLQTVLAKAAAYDLAQAKAHQVRRSGLPQVIRPGTGNANRGNGAESRVAELKARLRTSKGNEGIRLATELTRAKRALNGA
jgi:hypothetical protein